MKRILSIIALSVSLILLGMPALAGTPFVVNGTGNPAEDIPNVQFAVDNYKNVFLKGSFYFGYPVAPWPPSSNVVITKDVMISGETDENGLPMTTIYGGFWTFYAPLPVGDFNEAGPSVPGPKITIKNIHFDGALWTPIYISYTRGVNIKNNKITNVLPFGPLYLFGPDPEYWQHGMCIMTVFNDPRPAPAVVPNAITGPIVIKNNEIDLELYPPYDNPPYPPRNPLQTMGQGVFALWSWGAAIDIKNNTIINVTRNSIETLNHYKDDNGKGSISIKTNTIITAEEGIHVPSNNTPNGIVAGWFNDPGANPERTPEIFIKKNYIEGRGETSGGIMAIAPGAIIKDNEIVVNDGNESGSGASGIVIIEEGVVASENQITINPTTGMQNAAGSGILIMSDYATVKENQIIFDGESWSNGILQLASEGMISSNIIEGQGNTAVFLLPIITPTVQNNMISENNLENFSPSWADVVFYSGANYNTLVGEGGTVVDWGIENIITGDWTIMP